MGFTTQEEKQVRQMLDAFQNAQTITDLPEADGSNPNNLVVEVTEDGESKQLNLGALHPADPTAWYGIEYDDTCAAPECIRIGNPALHRTLPIHSKMRGCLLSDTGEVLRYLPQDDWTGETLDGSEGQVMVEIPGYFRKFETVGTVHRVCLSEHQLPGFHYVPTRYVSAYKASINRDEEKLYSCVNDSEAFRGGNNTADWDDDQYKTLIGRCVTDMSIIDLRNAARLRNEETTEWNILTYDVWKDLLWLFVVEYATRNSQAPFTAVLSPEGYRQGGLGMGVTTLQNWHLLNSYNPFIPNGYTNELGNNTGCIDYQVTYQQNNESKTETISVNRYRGIEMPFGMTWDWCDGLCADNHYNEDDSDLSTIRLITTDNPDLFFNFDESVLPQYRTIFEKTCYEIDGVARELAFGIHGDMVAVNPENDEYDYESHFCDYQYACADCGEDLGDNRYLGAVLVGGRADSESSAGLALVGAADDFSYTGTNCGSRLCFLPANT